MTNPPVVPGIAPSPESEAAFDRLHTASPADLTRADSYY
jgi:hypothetical protein